LPCTALAKDKLSQFFNKCTPVNFLSAQQSITETGCV
jgi:hypothetical protein